VQAENIRPDKQIKMVATCSIVILYVSFGLPIRKIGLKWMVPIIVVGLIVPFGAGSLSAGCSVCGWEQTWEVLVDTVSELYTAEPEQKVLRLPSGT
jgi:hypothetical protein